MTKTIKEGEVIVFEHGEYSDFGYSGPFRALKDFDTATVIGIYRVSVDQPDNPYISQYGFVEFLLKEKFIEDVPNVHTWYIGGYGFKPDWDNV